MKKIKTGDKVIVIAGANKGKEGKVSKVLNDKVVVDGINMVKKHLKPKNNNGTGEIIEVEAPIHISNVKLVSNSKETKKDTKKEVKKEVKAARTSKDKK